MPTLGGSSEGADYFDGIPLVDHHCHGLMPGVRGRAQFEQLATEADGPPAPSTTHLDSQVGFAIRRWCAPVLDLPPSAPAEEYVRRRDELGFAEVVARLVGRSSIGTLLIDTGYRGTDVLTPPAMTAATGLPCREVVRLEAVAERVALDGPDASGFADAYAEALGDASEHAVGTKSIIAYRHGFDFAPERPSAAEVRAAAGGWLRQVETHGEARLDDPVLLRHVLWAGVDRHLPLQLHVGYGDRDIRLHRNDPSLLTDFLRLTEAGGPPIMLLHCYPFQRQAGYLAQIYRHVHLDTGLAVNFVGVRAAVVVAESLELAPFAKVLFSSDAFGLPELYHLGSLLFRRAYDEVVGSWVEDGSWSAADARRVAEMIGRTNAERVYGLG